VRLQARGCIFYGIYLLGALVIGTVLPVGFVVLWFLVFGTAQFLLLRCPHCRKSAIVRPAGWTTPLAGRVCAYCEKAY
jgi:hypothetical protein